MKNLRIQGDVSNNYLEVDLSSETDADHSGIVRANLPTSALSAGYVESAFVMDSTEFHDDYISEDGEVYNAQGRLLFYSNFNGAAAGALINTQWNQQATTLTTALTGGFLRLNNGAVNTTNTGCAVNTARTFTIETGTALRVKGFIRHFWGAAPNKQFEFGLGMYAVAANQAGFPIEFIGFRWTQGGTLHGSLIYSTGGAVPGIEEIDINGGIPYSDNVVREYELIITENKVEFWVNRSYKGKITIQKGMSGTTKAVAYPVIARLFIGTAPAFAPVFDIGGVSVTRVGIEATFPINYRQALMGRHSMQGQAGLTATTGSTAVAVTNATAPTAGTGSNTAAATTGLGGQVALNGASFASVNLNINIVSFQNPAIPVAAGAASDARNLVITGLGVNQWIVTTILAGGPAVWVYFLAVGNTAVSYATTDAAGTTALGSKSPRFIPLPLSDNVAATAAVGTVVTRNGDNFINLATPVVVHPGEFISLGARPLSLTAITSGVFSGGVTFYGFWD